MRNKKLREYLIERRINDGSTCETCGHYQYHCRDRKEIDCVLFNIYRKKQTIINKPIFTNIGMNT